MIATIMDQEYLVGENYKIITQKNILNKKWHRLPQLINVYRYPIVEK